MDTIKGTYTSTIMRDLQTGFTVFRINTGSEVVVCSGIIVLPAKNMKVEVTGSWKDTKYGRQLIDCKLQELYDEDGLILYLEGIPGVSTRSAKLIASLFGTKLFDITSNENGPKLLASVPMISEEKGKKICQYVQKTKVFHELYEIIGRHNGKFSLASKIYKDFGENSVSTLTSDPYAMAIRYGFDFSMADSIAKEYGIVDHDPKRINGAVYSIVKKEAQSGNTYGTYIDVIDKTRKMLSSSEGEGVSSSVITMDLRRKADEFVVEYDRIYLRHLWSQELGTAKDIKRLMRSARPIKDKSVKDLIDYAEKVCHATYADQQREAFSLILNGGIGIITGGPGTGKSTVIRGLLCAYEKMCPTGVVKLCAPTGRAAQRMKEVTGHEAMTIHKLLEYTPFGDVVSYKDESDPIEADLLIVDESSMISIDIASMLFGAISNGTTVLLVGDINQLPAVGAGNVLGDMIDSGIIPTVKLTKTYRQAGDSLIINNAQRIQGGITKLVTGDDFEIITVKNDEEISTIVSQVFHKYYDPKNIFSAQVLCPGRRKRSTGSAQLSRTLQDGLSLSGPVLRYGENIYHKGDKIIFMKNNYAVGYFNGDMGTVTNIQENGMEVLVEGTSVYVDEENLDDVALGLAITIHKSQGSECAVAIVVLPSEPSGMLQRNLLYTAVTRAKKKCVIIATEGTIETSIKRVDNTKRNSKLVERLR